MDQTPNLALPYLAAAQSQKHVTHNEALRALDALVQLEVRDRNLTTPPTTPLEGDRHIVAGPATGAWSGQEAKVAAWQDGAWMFYPPQTGWLAWSQSEAALIVWNGTAWAAAAASAVNPVALVGVNTTADATNRLAVKSDASLFDNGGHGHQLKLNKATTSDTASVLYQTGYLGHAEVGACGDDNFHIKVSADGAAWHEALVIDRTTGVVTMPQNPPSNQVNADWNATSGIAQILNKPGLGSAAAQSATAFDAAGTAAAALATALQRANHTGTQPAATITGLAAVATSGSYADLVNKPTIPPAFALPVATASSLGGVKQGTGVTIAADGTLSAIASATSTVSGPSASTVGHIAIFNSTSGTVLADGGALAASATTDTTNAANIAAGTLPTARLPALTGDVTTTAGSAATALAPGGVTAGSYSNASLTVDAKGRIISATSGNGTGGSPVAPGGRLTLQSGVAVPTADIVGATTLYWTPSGTGLSAPIYTGAATINMQVTGELSMPLDATVSDTGYHAAASNFDVFLFNNAGVVAMGTGPSWASGATAGSNVMRGNGAGSTALQSVNGFWVNANSIVVRTGAATANTTTVPAGQALYVGTIGTTLAGATEDSKLKRLVWNAFNQAERPLYLIDSAANHVYSAATLRQVSANPANQFEFVLGMGGQNVDVTASSVVTSNGASASSPQCVIGLDSTVAPAAQTTSGMVSVYNGLYASPTCRYSGNPGLGRHILTYLEIGSGDGATQTWYNIFTNVRTGMVGRMLA